MNKKGVSRSLLSATKRWFVTNKPGVNTMQNAVVYTNDSIELQTRKLGDLYFMFGNYNLAFQVSAAYALESTLSVSTLIFEFSNPGIPSSQKRFQCRFSMAILRWCFGNGCNGRFYVGNK